MSAASPSTQPLFAQTPRKLAFMAAPTHEARMEFDRLVAHYGNCHPGDAEIIVCLGGDGFMLETLRVVLETQLTAPVYGMNCGSVGFLMNPMDEEDLPHRLFHAQAATLHPLRMTATTSSNETHEALALNDVYLFRQTRQAAKLRIDVDGLVRVPELICDGALLATPAGSTAYNLSAHGPIVPLSGNLLPLTPICAFRPRRWRGALLPSTAHVGFTVMEAEKRPVAAVADSVEVRDVTSVQVREDRNLTVTLLFDPGQTLSERIAEEQFSA
ncbi:NAD kinase [Acetobacter fabarum]|jgi:NAD+ kinase|uniref:NAD kinase n=1 Tax=Acetobacter TaxID=434 RepID=UPI000A3AED72|nr:MULTISPECIES: NAD kinase [Acetobacter]MDN6713782.1 NAD kinase [Acetobacter sp.]MCI1243073.1 NAD kinase [Acetobacter fabarum]MCI1908870.1 NAD kinase [Acetobacter fabarum]MCI1927714.1 NAD kinase [Acetobacter fabarum]MCI1947731.1 NAD kinase [Acetobacter fabarum]